MHGPLRFTNALGGTADFIYPGPAIDMQSPASAGAVNGTVYCYFAQSLDMSEWEIGKGAYNSGTGTFARTTIFANDLGTTAKIDFTHPPQIFVYDDADALATRVSALETEIAAWPGLVVGNLPFPAVQVPSANVNTLDDYEEGTWTPTITFATPGNLSVTYNPITGGSYTKIGRLVSVQFAIITSSFTWTTSSGAMLVNGLPFTPAPSNTNYRAYAPSVFNGINKPGGYTSIIIAALGNSSSMQLLASGMGAAADNVFPSDVPSGGTIILGGTMSYIV